MCLKYENKKSLFCVPFFLLLAITKEEENYEEAVKAINSCFGGGKLNSRLQEMLNDPLCGQLSKDVSYMPHFHIDNENVK